MNNKPPSNWRAGFKGKIQPACGGKEVPIFKSEWGWTLYCWDIVEQKHCTYFYKTDTFEYDI